MLWFCLQKFGNTSISHKYLEKGHTQNENDWIHATIESASRNIKIYTTRQWAQVIRAARRDHANVVKEMSLSYKNFQILHTRLRNNCSSLKHHLYLRNVVDSPNCGAIETNTHYFFECPLYETIRNKLIRSISYYEITIDLQTLLFGNDFLTFQENEEIFLKVQSYIRESKRFNE